jgi:leucyl aminopeptidase
MNIKLNQNIQKDSDLIILAKEQTDFKLNEITQNHADYIENEIKKEKKIIELHQDKNKIHIIILEENKKNYKTKEKARISGYKAFCKINSDKTNKIQIINQYFEPNISLSFIEGFLLSTYKFDKYITKDKKQNYPEEIIINDTNINDKDIEKLQIIVEGVFITRDLVNEPYSSLNSIELAERLETLSKQAGFSIEILNKKQIETLKMGGILAVNKASKIPATFSILEWNPQTNKKQKPIILVGKGIVFDTGGYNLKPGQYMNDMKADMAGAAAVAGTIYIISKLKLPVHIIGLIPSTDNMIGRNGYVTGDIIKMHNGMSVEILNTDAEGRLILADALSYAQKYDPQLVIDLATLTGAAMRAVGEQAIAMMGTANKKIKKALIKSGKATYERLIQFPLWEEYAESLKSKIADIKNIGGANAGQITAAKFLENFTKYPWIHLDIASNAYIENQSTYRGQAATGIPVRLLTNFIENNF